MNEAIGGLLPAAVAVALSPIPIIGVVLILSSAHARPNGIAFAVGWLAGLVAVSVVVLVVAGGSDESGSASADTVSWGTLAIGVLLLAMGMKQWRHRPRRGEVPVMPKWMATIDTVTPPKSLVLGLALSGINPKNLALTAAAAASIAQAGLDTADTVIAVAVFVAIGSVTVVGAVLVYLIAGQRSAGALASLKDFMADHNAVIMFVVLVLLGAKLVGDSLPGVSG